MRKSIIICMIALLGITGCGGKKAVEENRQETAVLETSVSEAGAEETKKSAEETEPEGDDFSRHFTEITVDGKTLTIPATYEELKACGFEIKGAYKDMVYDGEEVNGELTHTAHENSRFPVIFAFKGEEGSKKIEDCEVVSFSIDADTMKDTKIEFYGGLTIESSREDAAALLEEDFADEESAQYIRFLDENKRSGMDVYFYEDRLLTVHVNNYADYFEQ